MCWWVGGFFEILTSPCVSVFFLVNPINTLPTDRLLQSVALVKCFAQWPIIALHESIICWSPDRFCTSRYRFSRFSLIRNAEWRRDANEINAANYRNGKEISGSAYHVRKAEVRFIDWQFNSLETIFLTPPSLQESFPWRLAANQSKQFVSTLISNRAGLACSIWLKGQRAAPVEPFARRAGRGKLIESNKVDFANFAPMA